MTHPVSLIWWKTTSEKAKGLQEMEPIPERTLFIFTDIRPGTLFHSRNVRETFDIAFVSKLGRVLSLETVFPEEGTSTAPDRTAYAIEAKAGEMESMNITSGKTLNMKTFAPFEHTL